MAGRYASLSKKGIVEVLLFPLASLSLVHVVIDAKRGSFVCIPKLVVHRVAGAVGVGMIVHTLVVQGEVHVDKGAWSHLAAAVHGAGDLVLYLHARRSPDVLPRSVTGDSEL